MQLDPLESEYKSIEPILKSSDKKKGGTKIVCPSCSKDVNATDINIQDKIAKCSSCHEVFSFENKIQSLLTTKPKKNKPIVGKQKDIDVFEYEDDLSISITNFTDWIAFIALFVSTFGTILIMGLSSESGFNPLPFIIPLWFLFFYSIYRFVGYRNNKTYIDVEDQYLYIRNRPRNFSKDKQYLVENIRQFYPKQYGQEGNMTGYFHVYMVYDGPNGEEHIKVSPYLRSRSRALYIEQSLEAFLNIPDETVPEES